VDNPLVVPVDKKVRIITTANDVIHAWMVPAFGVKQDAIPGFVRDTWFRAEKVGDYYGQCAELCGKEHAYMPIHVKVLSAEDYAKWVEGKKKEMAAKADDPSKVWTLDALAQARGEKVYAANCAACHKAETARAPVRSRRWTARPSCWTPTRPSRSPSCSRAEQRRDAGVEAAQRHRDRRRHHLHQEQLVQQDRPVVQPAESWPLASDPPHLLPESPHLPLTRPRPMSAVLDHHGHDHDHAHDHDHHGPRRLAALGVRHQPQGHRHDVPAVLVHHADGRRRAGAADPRRAVPARPAVLVNPELFNQLTTMHGLIMVFGAIMPAFVGFANWMIPLQIGASDMAFARMNNFSFWLLIPAASCWWARSSCPAARPLPAGRCMRR
jgi:mono/diheme cytochrome c family protein/diadenosine tetraphosphatase ApaH/serine/threonine PP2A family protein phosphatase